MQQISYLFHPKGNWMEVVISGKLNDVEMLSAYNRFLADPQFRTGMHLLCDLRQADLKAGLDSLQQLVANVATSRGRRGENYRVALLVSYAFQESMSRLYAMLTRSLPFECQVFKSRTTAVRWLLGDTMPPDPHEN